VNKCDRVGAPDPEFYAFYGLGLGDPIEVSAIHGHGTGDLLDACVAEFPPEDEEEAEDDRIKVAIVGKPNVGKSSRVTQSHGQAPITAASVAGSTGEGSQTGYENGFRKYCYIAATGMRRRCKVSATRETYANLRATSSIERSRDCLMLFDPTEAITD